MKNWKEMFCLFNIAYHFLSDQNLPKIKCEDLTFGEAADTNSVGYTCNCNAGYEGDGGNLDYDDGCTDIDECADGDDDCTIATVQILKIKKNLNKYGEIFFRSIFSFIRQTFVLSELIFLWNKAAGS